MELTRPARIAPHCSFAGRVALLARPPALADFHLCRSTQ